MKKIVVTFQLKKKLQPQEHRHVLKAMMSYLEHGTFTEGLEDAISCGTCLENVSGLKAISIELKK